MAFSSGDIAGGNVIKSPWDPTVIHPLVVGVGRGVMVALRTQVCTAVGNLNSDTELQGLCRVACKENRSGERDQGLFSSPFLGHYLLFGISTSLPAARDPPQLTDLIIR